VVATLAIISGAPAAIRLRSGYSCESASRCRCPHFSRLFQEAGLLFGHSVNLSPTVSKVRSQFPKMKFTVICVSTSIDSPLRMYGR
jgi:hypothetical protein